MATASEAIMIELEKEGCQWIKSERFQKRQAEEQKRREAENPMKVGVVEMFYSTCSFNTITLKHCILKDVNLKQEKVMKDENKVVIYFLTKM